MNVLHSPVIADRFNEASKQKAHKVKVKIKVKAKFFTKTVLSPEDIVTSISIADRAHYFHVDEAVAATS